MQKYFINICKMERYLGSSQNWIKKCGNQGHEDTLSSGHCVLSSALTCCRRALTLSVSVDFSSLLYFCQAVLFMGWEFFTSVVPKAHSPAYRPGRERPHLLSGVLWHLLDPTPDELP